MHALVRDVPPSLIECELTHITRAPIDLERAKKQHRAYCQALAAGGVEVHRLPPTPSLPDSVFVQDTAFVLPELAVIGRMGARSRRQETQTVSNYLARHRRCVEIQPPGTLDGGDIIQVGDKLFVGVGGRTNAEGAAQLELLASNLGLSIHRVPIERCLHLTTGASAVRGDHVLVNPLWLDPAAFTGCSVVTCDPDEPFGGNVVALAGTIIGSAAAPQTCSKLESLGYDVVTIENSELIKAEGSLTCLSVLFE